MRKDDYIMQCPACTPNMVAVSADGTRKAYRFIKSKGFVIVPYCTSMQKSMTMKGNIKLEIYPN